MKLSRDWWKEPSRPSCITVEAGLSATVAGFAVVCPVAAALLVVLAEQLGHGHAQHVAQTAEVIQAGGHLGVLDLAQHALADPGDARHIGQFQFLRLALAFDLNAQVLLKLELRLFFRRTHRLCTVSVR